ncbi:Non-canonical purine NTP pyrophosphatase protein [Haloplasma contractile SSD-17B]|uniref:Non-canonical purine NTP pyrophosphatase protein n=1 Tax=Haloplasma contractile SSD-17B TaxID=1033810 RepID=U2EF32_9MOLU|nr:non-canonical purine NTP pyrophosphatase [Haloplasma contractile]ERJ13533.1 Non-canonical purine NTP pyrophosphatase protein [Haloplasma contractile SSD-17B]
MKELVIATKNKGKIKEYEALFNKFNISVKSLYDFKEPIDIDETGTTFHENALIKANTIKERYNIPVLADDSGLAVDALNGAPGIYSARYAGLEKDDQANNLKLLRELEGVPEAKRTLHFPCVPWHLSSQIKTLLL